MKPTMVLDWNNKEIELVQSAGGVWAVVNPYDNLITTDCEPWPQSEILQKLYKSRHEHTFKGDAQLHVTRHLSYYCDLQSLHSEDAITWSVFGSLKNSSVSNQERWIESFLGLMDISASVKHPHIYLWRRIPHPDTNCMGGPEIDVGIITSDTYIIIECKWLSKNRTTQGVCKNKDQISLRKEYIEKMRKRLLSTKAIIETIGISLYPDAFYKSFPASDQLKTTTWREICSIAEHPLADEVERYYYWKTIYGL